MSDNNDPWVDAKVIAKNLAIGRAKVYRMATDGTIPGIKIDGTWRFRWSDVEASLKERSGYWQPRTEGDSGPALVASR